MNWKKFYSLDGMPLSKLKNHAEWIHPDLWPECGLSELEKNLMKGIAKLKENFKEFAKKRVKNHSQKEKRNFILIADSHFFTRQWPMARV